MVDVWASGAAPTSHLGSGNGSPADTLAAPNNFAIAAIESLTVIGL